MLQIAKLIPLLCLAFLIQIMPFSTAQAAATKRLKVSVNKNYFLLKPGETAIVEIDVAKIKATDQIDLKVKTSPLEIRTTEDSFNTNSMIHHATMQVTVPAASELKSYSVVLTASNDHGKSKNVKLTFNLADPDPSPDFNIVAASYSVANEGNPAIFYLNGTGFGATPRVIVNGLEITAKIFAVTDNTIELRGVTKEDFNFNDAQNEILVDVNGRITNRFILNLDPSF